MTEHTLTSENLLAALPAVLAEDSATHGLASAVGAELDRLVQATHAAEIYTRIDALDEPLLDLLARDFKVDWWRPDASIEDKRNALKVSWYVHRHLGTPEAIRRAIADFIGEGKLEEWFEYGGKPYHYRITGGNNDAIIENNAVFMGVLSVVTRGSAVLDRIQAVLQGSQHIDFGIAMRILYRKTVSCEPADLTSFTLLTDGHDRVLTTSGGSMLTL